jgi:hypothetical protein
MLPEISPGSYLAPQVRYGIDFEGNDDGRMLRQLRIAPTLNINLPHNLFFTLYPSPDIRLNYGDARVGPDGPIVSAAQFHGRLETDRAYSDFSGVRRSYSSGFSRLHFQDPIESWLFVLVPVPVDPTGLVADSIQKGVEFGRRKSVQMAPRKDSNLHGTCFGSHSRSILKKSGVRSSFNFSRRLPERLRHGSPIAVTQVDEQRLERAGVLFFKTCG